MTVYREKWLRIPAWKYLYFIYEFRNFSIQLNCHLSTCHFSWNFLSKIFDIYTVISNHCQYFQICCTESVFSSWISNTIDAFIKRRRKKLEWWNQEKRPSMKEIPNLCDICPILNSEGVRKYGEETTFIKAFLNK